MRSLHQTEKFDTNDTECYDTIGDVSFNPSEEVLTYKNDMPISDSLRDIEMFDSPHVVVELDECEEEDAVVRLGICPKCTAPLLQRNLNNQRRSGNHTMSLFQSFSSSTMRTFPQMASLIDNESTIMDSSIGEFTNQDYDSIRFSVAPDLARKGISGTSEAYTNACGIIFPMKNIIEKYVGDLCDSVCKLSNVNGNSGPKRDNDQKMASGTIRSYNGYDYYTKDVTPYCRICKAYFVHEVSDFISTNERFTTLSTWVSTAPSVKDCLNENSKRERCNPDQPSNIDDSLAESKVKEENESSSISSPRDIFSPHELLHLPTQTPERNEYETTERKKNETSQLTEWNILPLNEEKERFEEKLPVDCEVSSSLPEKEVVIETKGSLDALGHSRSLRRRNYLNILSSNDGDDKERKQEKIDPLYSQSEESTSQPLLHSFKRDAIKESIDSSAFFEHEQEIQSESKEIESNSSTSIQQLLVTKPISSTPYNQESHIVQDDRKYHFHQVKEVTDTETVTQCSKEEEHLVQEENIKNKVFPSPWEIIPDIGERESNDNESIDTNYTLEEKKKIIENYGQKRQIATKAIGRKLMEGYALTQTQCSLCEMPVMEFDGESKCVVCPLVFKKAKKRADLKRKGQAIMDTVDSESPTKENLMSKKNLLTVNSPKDKDKRIISSISQSKILVTSNNLKREEANLLTNFAILEEGERREPTSEMSRDDDLIGFRDVQIDNRNNERVEIEDLSEKDDSYSCGQGVSGKIEFLESRIEIDSLSSDHLTPYSKKDASIMADSKGQDTSTNEEVYRLLLSGWLLANSYCPDCQAPMMKSPDKESKHCVFCKVEQKPYQHSLNSTINTDDEDFNFDSNLFGSSEFVNGEEIDPSIVNNYSTAKEYLDNRINFSVNSNNPVEENKIEIQADDRNVFRQKDSHDNSGEVAKNTDSELMNHRVGNRFLGGDVEDYNHIYFSNGNSTIEEIGKSSFIKHLNFRGPGNLNEDIKRIENSRLSSGEVSTTAEASSQKKKTEEKRKRKSIDQIERIADSTSFEGFLTLETENIESSSKLNEKIKLYGRAGDVLDPKQLSDEINVAVNIERGDLNFHDSFVKENELGDSDRGKEMSQKMELNKGIDEKHGREDNIDLQKNCFTEEKDNTGNNVEIASLEKEKTNTTVSLDGHGILLENLRDYSTPITGEESMIKGSNEISSQSAITEHNIGKKYIANLPIVSAPIKKCIQENNETLEHLAFPEELDFDDSTALLSFLVRSNDREVLLREKHTSNNFIPSIQASDSFRRLSVETFALEKNMLYNETYKVETELTTGSVAKSEASPINSSECMVSPSSINSGNNDFEASFSGKFDFKHRGLSSSPNSYHLSEEKIAKATLVNENFHNDFRENVSLNKCYVLQNKSAIPNIEDNMDIQLLSPPSYNTESTNFTSLSDSCSRNSFAGKELQNASVNFMSDLQHEPYEILEFLGGEELRNYQEPKSASARNIQHDPLIGSESTSNKLDGYVRGEPRFLDDHGKDESNDQRIPREIVPPFQQKQSDRESLPLSSHEFQQDRNIESIRSFQPDTGVRNSKFSEEILITRNAILHASREHSLVNSKLDDFQSVARCLTCSNSMRKDPSSEGLFFCENPYCTVFMIPVDKVELFNSAMNEMNSIDEKSKNMALTSNDEKEPFASSHPRMKNYVTSTNFKNRSEEKEREVSNDIRKKPAILLSNENKSINTESNLADLIDQLALAAVSNDA